jgi:DNA-binding transcriptional regulator YiaG
MARNPSHLSPVIRKLKAWRAANHLSQNQAVCALVDAGLPVKLSTLQQWEIARSSPHPVTAAALEKFLSDQKKTEVSTAQKTVAPVMLRLKAWRHANNLSQAQAVHALVAAGLPAKVRTLQDWEIGRRSPRAITAVALERFLDEHPTISQPATNRILPVRSARHRSSGSE